MKQPSNPNRDTFDADSFNAAAAKVLAIVSAAGIIATLLTFMFY